MSIRMTFTENCGCSSCECKSKIFQLTGNYGKMAREAGIGDVIFRPETLGIVTAHQMLKPLVLALRDLARRPDDFRDLEPSNGWGTYEDFMEDVGNILLYTITYPQSTVEVGP